jgi:hypothetical protein
MGQVRTGHGLLIRLAALAAAVAFAFAPGAFAASVNVAWDANTEPDLTGYKVHYGVASLTYTTHVDAGKTLSRTLDALAAGTRYYIAVTAYDSLGNESGYSNEISATTPAVVETISAPQRPAGPAIGSVGIAYTYSTSGAVSSTGEPVQYRFSWSDGSNSNWLPVGVLSATKAWSTPGSYTLVSVEARCALHTTVVSAPSAALTVTIAAAVQETVSTPAAPGGPTNGVVGTAYTYTAGGAVSSAGHSVEYRFSWSDGSVSAWVPAAAASASKTWNAPGKYTLVSVEARCALHPGIISAASPAITVTIASGVAETVSSPAVPSGPAGGSTRALYMFTTGGSASSAGDLVVYRFHWGDGTASDWVGPDQPVSVGKSWDAPGTYLVQAEAACVTHPTIGAFSQAFEVTIVEQSAAPRAQYVLWANGGSGQAIRWKVDPASGAMTDWKWVSSPAGAGSGWLAASYVQGDAATDYLLWTNVGTGQAIRWKVDPVAGSMTGWSWISSSSGVGGGWQASSYVRGDATADYVLWTNSGTGQAIRWKVDPATGSMTGWSWVSSPSGAGSGWLASSYARGDATTDYVLWSNSNTGQAIRWKVDPASGSMTGWSWISSSAGVGAGWFASGYVRGDATTDAVLWTNSGTGQAIRWKVDRASGAMLDWSWISPASGVGGGWLARSFGN